MTDDQITNPVKVKIPKNRHSKVEIAARRREVLQMLREGNSYSTITETIAKAYNTGEANVYADIDHVLHEIKRLGELHQGRELFRMLEQYDDLYLKALAKEDFKTCCNILGNKAKIMGLEETVVRHIHEQLESIKSMSDREIMANVQMILAERSKEILDQVNQSEEGKDNAQDN